MVNSSFLYFCQLLSVVLSVAFRISCTLANGMYKRKVPVPEDSPLPKHLVGTDLLVGLYSCWCNGRSNSQSIS